ncbi:MAG: hypothetical protein V7K72_09845, partial [Nostoc sp.]|uniref:hypothetical protein n=1 Tax=Nostoc sp. TaxID=1180 RepID=UPI002FF9EA27
RLSSPLLISDRLFFSDFLCCIYYLICQCVSPDGYSPVPLFLSLSLQEEYNNGRFMYIGS